ncbi:hypothetical protein DFA_02012 [Cavenderia fasciculata]|uniref:Right handed beta helix domain-containing protein n=1 Tax=Cavenderia fasciculata TaxID=261658 RepID=F4PYG1_CACFS|nr:uncharacterized protein DFA_02012 [Cavenderia fasciculata]EGG19227.1 hypothetical protein DFA_02012 [Cavenderia fasciculata]|eukprot:XP_004357498.1 hypothetical protein DFA_02012 [Cavenderia fasciculata]
MKFTKMIESGWIVAPGATSVVVATDDVYRHSIIVLIMKWISTSTIFIISSLVMMMIMLQIHTTTATATALTLYVNVNSTNTNATCGATIALACRDIQSAFDYFYATTSNNSTLLTIEMEGGVYQAERNANFAIFNQSLTIQSSSLDNNQVIIDFGNVVQVPFYFIQVVVPPNAVNTYNQTNVTLTGIVFRNLQVSINQPGGIFYTPDASANVALTVNYCEFTKLTSSKGVIWVQSATPNSQLVIFGCTFNSVQANSTIVYAPKMSIQVNQTTFQGCTSRFVIYQKGGVGVYDTNRFSDNVVTTTETRSTGGILMLYNNDMELFNTMVNCVFTNNTVASGALILGLQSMTIQTTSFTGNYNSTALMCVYSIVRIYNSKFINNAGYYGQVYASQDCTIRIYQSDMIGNSADSIGGAITLFDSYLYLNGVTVKGNSATGNGAGIYNSNSQSDIQYSTFQNNYSGANGGAIYSNESTISVNNSTFTSNQAAEYGGIIECIGYSIINIDNNTFSNNVDLASDKTSLPVHCESDCSSFGNDSSPDQQCDNNTSNNPTTNGLTNGEKSAIIIVPIAIVAIIIIIAVIIKKGLLKRNNYNYDYSSIK